MSLEDRIIEQVQKLPEDKKAEVLDFVEYLRLKIDDKEWSSLSLESAISGMEDETSVYSLSDIKESF
ncbi:MAG TPA: DUF2281 domain-containing protein [Spirochaetota bacterium]|nr:DUF2281 domain-containing protein [Spirochaetota bacterium]HQO40662.1 DUF2281 domain-containing protein [Spirochaetota bacterium]